MTSAGALLLWLTLRTAADPAPLFGEVIIHRTSPPPDVAIELTDEQAAELTEAWQSGFDHPDPGSSDPCTRLQLLPYKKLSAWRKQFRKRGFTIQKVKDILQNGRREPYLHPEKGTTYTKIFDARGNWIVVDCYTRYEAI